MVLCPVGASEKMACHKYGKRALSLVGLGHEIHDGPWLVPDSGHAKLILKGVTSGSGPEARPGPAGNGNDRKRRTGQA
jgi:hypothetical protein